MPLYAKPSAVNIGSALIGADAQLPNLPLMLYTQLAAKVVVFAATRAIENIAV